MADSKVWFITGSSKGFGRIWAEAALERGDKVAATARDASTLEPLTDKYGDDVLALALDVQDHDADFAAVQQAAERFGRLDVVVNNAGYGLFGAVEEVSPEQARDQIETNLFGALWVTQAALPIMREQGSGHIIQVSSIGGVTAFPGIGMYHASKWALEAFSQSLAREVADLGIHVTSIEPQGYSTDWAGPSAIHADPIDAYEPIREAQQKRRASIKSPGDPDATGPAILKLVDAENPPLRCFFGADAFAMVRPDYEGRIASWEEWDWLAQEAHGER
jgi:NAD(P)-dependent dehydrogenase (short-subunit alcohol dehydrogenase family)